MSIKLMKKKWLKNVSEVETTEEINGLNNSNATASTETTQPTYTTITTNVYVDGNKRRVKENKSVRCYCSYSEEDRNDGRIGCGTDCLNRILFVECGTRCPVGPDCTNKRFQNCQYAPLERRPAGKKGSGLFAMRDIRSGDFLIEYVGEVLDSNGFAKRSRKYDRDKQHRHHYFMSLGKGEVIDATEEGNISRFINHSCDPNAETQKWTVTRQLRIGFFAKKAIKKDEEITFDYQFERFGQEAQKCYCGSSKCRGTIGAANGRTTSLKGEEDEPEEESSEPDSNDARQKEKRRKALMDDLEIVNQREKLLALGNLKNNDQVIQFCRLMVRGDDFENKMKLLDVLLDTTQPILSIFATAGLKLIWIWMLDEENSDVLEMTKLRLKLLDVLQHMTDNQVFGNRNQLDDSGLIRLLEKWVSRRSDTAAPSTSAALLSDNTLTDLSEDSGIVIRSNDDTVVIQGLLTQLIDSVSAGDPSATPSASSSESVDTMEPNDTMSLSDGSPDQHQFDIDDFNEKTELEELQAEIKSISQNLLHSWKKLVHKINFKIPKVMADRSSLKIRRRSSALGLDTVVQPKSVLGDRERITRTLRSWHDGATKKSLAAVAQRDADRQLPPLAASDRKRLHAAVAGSPSTATEPKRRRPSRFDVPPSPGSVTTVGIVSSSSASDLSLSGGRSVDYPANDTSTPDFNQDKSDPRKLYTKNVEKNESIMQENEFEMALAEATEQLEKEDVVKPIPTVKIALPSKQLVVVAGQKLRPDLDARPIKPGLLVRDPQGKHFWQERVSEEIMFPATSQQVEQVRNGVLSDVPWFLYNAADGTVTQKDKPPTVCPSADKIIQQQAMMAAERHAAATVQAVTYAAAYAPYMTPYLGSTTSSYCTPYLGAAVHSPSSMKKAQIAALQRQIEILSQYCPEDDQSVIATVPPPPPPVEPTTSKANDMRECDMELSDDDDEPLPCTVAANTTTASGDISLALAQSSVSESVAPAVDCETAELEHTANAVQRSEHRPKSALDRRLEVLMTTAEESTTTNDDTRSTSSPPPPVAPVSPEIKLPPGWSSNKDKDGNVYYYNISTRVPQWTPPQDGAISTTSVKSDHSKDTQPTTSSPLVAAKQNFKSPTTTAAADTSSDVASRRARERFKADISKVVIKAMEPFKRAKKFASQDQFKKTARKLSHGILEKEEKKGIRPEKLAVTKSVAKKAKDFVAAYCIEKLGASVARSSSS